MSTLYEITGDYLRLFEMLEDDGGMDPQAFKDTLEGMDGEFEDKADGYAKVIRELDAEADKFKAEGERMAAKASTISNNSARLKRHLYESMKATGKTKFKTDLFSFGIHRNGGKKPMEIVPDVGIPDEYYKKEPDNAKIRKALESGTELPFAVLRERGDHLVIQ